MRYAIWEEDDYFQPIHQKRIEMDPAVVEIPEGMVCDLIWQYDSTKIYGKISDVKLVDGEISGEVVFHDDKELNDQMMDELRLRLGGFYTRVVKEPDGEVERITACELSGVSIVPIFTMPPKERR